MDFRYVHLETEAAGEKAAAVPAERTRAEMIFMVLALQRLMDSRVAMVFGQDFHQQRAGNVEAKDRPKTMTDGRTLYVKLVGYVCIWILVLLEEVKR